MNKLKGSKIPLKNDVRSTIIEYLKKAMDKKIIDAVISPIRVPSGDAYSYVLIKDKKLLEKANPIPPVMFVQGSKAISSVTRMGEGKLKIAAILRPCETRATIELAKMAQAKLDNIILISMDCPGVIPTKTFLDNPDKSIKIFNEDSKNWKYDSMRPVCQICDKSNMVTGDVHIGIHGAKKDQVFMISGSKKGEEFLNKLDLDLKDNIDNWIEKVKKIKEEKIKIRNKKNKELKSKISGIDNFIDIYKKCINCHNCMSVCPICFCRLCYFDSDKVRHKSNEYLRMAEKKGSIRFLPDTSLFQIGRMMHMSVSCVSCGACEDACPVSIPVAQIFTMMGDETQKLFDYVSGRDLEEPVPLIRYKEKELTEVEDANE